MSNFHDQSSYVICKCFFLSGLFLACALILSVWSSAYPVFGLHLRHYISYAQTSSIIVLAAGLFGGLFLEDILQKTQ